MCETPLSTKNSHRSPLVAKWRRIRQTGVRCQDARLFWRESFTRFHEIDDLVRAFVWKFASKNLDAGFIVSSLELFSCRASHCSVSSDLWRPGDAPEGRSGQLFGVFRAIPLPGASRCFMSISCAKASAAHGGTGWPP